MITEQLEGLLKSAMIRVLQNWDLATAQDVFWACHQFEGLGGEFSPYGENLRTRLTTVIEES